MTLLRLFVANYLLLAVVTILVALPLAWFVLRETPDAEQIEQGDELKNAQLESQTQSHIKLSTLLGNKLIWQLFLIFSLLSFGLYGILAHLFPMLSDKGMASADAAMVQFTLGMAVVVSRMMVGYIIDRFLHLM